MFWDVCDSRYRRRTTSRKKDNTMAAFLAPNHIRGLQFTNRPTITAAVCNLLGKKRVSLLLTILVLCRKKSISEIYLFENRLWIKKRIIKISTCIWISAALCASFRPRTFPSISSGRDFFLSPWPGRWYKGKPMFCWDILDSLAG